MKTLVKVLAVGAIVASLNSGNAMADNSNNLYRILDRLYGWEHLERIYDDMEWTSSLIFDSYIYGVQSVAKYSSKAQTLYYQLEGQAPVKLFTIPADYPDFDISVSLNTIGIGHFSANMPYLTCTPSLFWLNDNDSNTVDFWSSRDTNYDSKDHMLSYRIIDYSDQDHPNNIKGDIIIAWEDDPYGEVYGMNNRDFNDLIVQVHITPEPSSVFLVCVGLIGVVGLRRKFGK